MSKISKLWDTPQKKINIINGITGIAVIGILFAVGFISKELFVILMINKGIGKVTTWLIG